MRIITCTHEGETRRQLRKIVRIGEGMPMIGTRAFGIVDMGTNIIEVRPTSLCPLSCIFCSVNAGPKSTVRWAEFIVEYPDLLAEAVREIVKYKACSNIEIHIDGMGEPGTYHKLTELVQALREIPQVKVISMQTRLVTFSEKKILDLADSGLDRFNVSIDALDPELARRLADTSWYNIERVLDLVKFTINNTRADVVLTPVWIPTLNDEEIPKIVTWAKENRLGKRWPPVLIQKYVPHKHGRKPPVPVMSWGEFYDKLRELERKLNVKLIPSNEDFNIKRAKPVPTVYRKGEVVKVEIIARGIFINEYIAVPVRRTGSQIHDRVITVIADSKLEDVLIGQRVRVKIIENRNNVYIAKPIDF